jgi:hypothetical protein
METWGQEVAEWGDHQELRVRVAAYRGEVPAACRLDDRQLEVLDEW